MYRKTVPALVVGALLALSACGSSDSGDTAGSDGVKTGPGVTDKAIKVGFLTDYSGPIADAATNGSLGGEVYFKTVNAAGGVCGRQIEVVKGDTKYDAQQTTQAYRAMSHDVLTITQILGNASINAIQDSLKRDDMSAGAISLTTTTAKIPNIYVPLPTFEIEIINGLVWAAEEAKASADNPFKVGFITPSDPFGEVYLEALQETAKSLPGVEVVATPTVAVTDKDYTAQVSELKSKGAEAVMSGLNLAQTATLVGTAAQLGYDPTYVSQSGGWNAALAAPLKGLLDKFYVSAGYASYADDDIQGVKDLRAAMAEYAPDAKENAFQVAGWMFGVTTVDALKKACENKDLTRKGVAKALEDLEIDYSGMTPNVNMGNGDEPVSYYSRMTKTDAAGSLIPINDFTESDAAKAWGEENFGN